MGDVEVDTLVGFIEESVPTTGSVMLDRISSLEANYEQCSGKVNELNSDFQVSKGRLDGFGKELKIMLAEINIISEWIFDKFGVQLIDKDSFLFKHIHEYEEVLSISSSLSLLNKSSGQVSCSNQRRDSSESSEDGGGEDGEEYEPPDRPKQDHSMFTSESDLESFDDGDGEENESILSVEEAEEYNASLPDAETSRPKRNSRRKINYKEFTVETTEQDSRPCGKLMKKFILKKSSPVVEKTVKKRGRKPGAIAPSFVQVDSMKVPKRGRPKKPPSEKVENWKNRLPVQCDECGKIFKGSGSLRTHKMIHLGSRPFECNECGKAFRRKHHLEFHLMVHAGDKKLQCRFCGKMFHIPRDLSRHERTHTGEKPFACHFCPKTFNIKPHLTMHIRTHTGERPYKCNICEKCFSQSNSLRIHKKIHFKVANPNLDPDSKKKPKGKAKLTKPKKSETGFGDDDANALKIDTDNIGLDQTDSATNITVDERGIPTNLIIIHEQDNLSTQSETLIKCDSPPSQESVNYIVEDRNVEVQGQQQQNFFDPVQQAWRMAVSQAQPSQTTSVIMNSRIDTHSVQIRNMNERNLVPNSTSSIPPTHSTANSSYSFSIPQLYDANLRYFNP